MAQTKIALAPPQTIPLDRLRIGDANVRQIKGGVSIESLAESIARCGLLQSLSVRPILDDQGVEIGTYGVQAGGRRLRALQLLVKQKKLAKNAPIPCIVKTGGIAEVDSLAENTEREALHPLDQFRAFSALRDKGQGEEQIAAAFGVTSAVVRQRLKLMAVNPALLKLYEDDELTLDQLMAFTICDDKDRQLKTWESARKGWDKSPATIRRLLTETTVRAGDRRAVFVGAEAYKAAGGIIIRDLFEDDNGGWLQDADLLNRMVEDKLALEAEKIRSEGWKWVELALDFPHGHKRDLRVLTPVAPALSEAEEEEYDALCTEHDELVEPYSEDEDLPDNIVKRVEELTLRINEFAIRAPVFDPADIARGGAFVSVLHTGALRVERGFLRPEDFRSNAKAPNNSDGDGAEAHDPETGETTDDLREGTGHHAQAMVEEPDTGALPERLKTELTAYRTLALREAMAGDPETAYLSVLHALALRLLYRYSGDSCLQIQANDALTPPFPGLNDTPAAKAIDVRHQTWQQRLPERSETLWAALCDLVPDDRARLFAHCVGLTINAVHEAHNPQGGKVRHAHILAGTLSLDMRQAGWLTTAENYLKRVTKDRIMEAVREAKGEETAALLADLKKGEMATEAERLLRDTDWLPELLRAPDLRSADQPDAESAGLPAFLEAAE